MKTIVSALIALSVSCRRLPPPRTRHGTPKRPLLAQRCKDLVSRVVGGRDLDRRAMERQIHQFGVYDRCMLKPRDTPCLGINVAQK